MSKSPITTDDSDWSNDPADWLHNPHAGECLALDFLQPLKMPSAELALRLGVDVHRIDTVIAGDVPMDADLDLRLGRYFGMSPGFFLRFQAEHDLIEARRRGGDAFDRIVPRAA